MKATRLASFAVLTMVAGAAIAVDRPWTDQPFDGTWVVQPELTTFGMRSPAFSIDRGVFRRNGCKTPAIEVPADGAVHRLQGQPLFDALSVRILDAKRIEITEASGDKPLWKGSYTVSANGRAMTLDFEDSRAARAVTGRLSYSREGDPVAAAHLTSGTWRPEQLSRLSPSGLTMTISTQKKDVEKDSEVTPGPDFLATYTLKRSDGLSAEGKLDAHDFPLNGFLPGATLAVNRLQPAILQFNRSQDGVLVELSRASVSNDGQTMTLNQIDWQCQEKTVLILNKEMP